MKPSLRRVADGLASVRNQWRDRPALRWGFFAIAGILAFEGVSWQQERTAAKKREMQVLQTELKRMRSVMSGPDWTARGKEAADRLRALQSMAWLESTPGLAQASFQDWLNQSANRAGVQVRELRLDAAAAGNERSDPARPAKDEAEPRLGREARARLVVDFKPRAIGLLLQDMASSPRAVMIDRFQVRTWVQPPQAEFDLRIEVLTGSGQP